MSRVRADDYDTKYQSILDSAAALFADVGYPSAKMQNIAKACDASKSMLYHYFPTKDDLLLALLSEHLERLLAEIKLAIDGPAPAKQRLLYSLLKPSCKSPRSATTPRRRDE